jgi:UDP-4-amino-4,6-dideoxy-N-acetyl-beta-L-altrosamine transaminase
MIPYGRQEITPEDINSVIDSLNSEFLTQGPTVPLFEQKIAKYCEAKYGIAVNSATSALHIACLALELGPGDYLWTTAITFVASANCALYCGARVDLVDINPKTFNIDLEILEKKLKDAAKNGKKPKVVIPVHMCGQSAEMKSIRKLSLQFGFKVIEDASHAIGSKYLDKTVGSCEYSDITVFSFHPVKIITTTEGGIALTNDADLASRMELFRSHGITRDKDKMYHPSEGPWYYEQIALGFNYRMTDLQAALGISQLDRLETYVEQRNKIAKIYDHELAGFPIKTPFIHKDVYSSFHLYVIRLIKTELNRSHLEIFNALRHSGIGVNLHYIPIYRQPLYQKMGFDPKDFPQAEKYYSEAISLPIYPQLTQAEQDIVISSLKAELLK